MQTDSRQGKIDHRSKFHAIKQYALAPLLIALTVTLSTAQAGWQRTWSDPFDGDSVDWSNWTAQTQANYNNEVQCYTDDDRSAERNYDVSGGTLKIIARRQVGHYCDSLPDDIPDKSRDWTSGRLNSKDKQEFLYGRIEARIRFLNLEGGTWPAFWMLENRIAEQPIAGDDDLVNWPNPGAGEIDVWEWFSNEPDTYITNFFNTEGCGSEIRYTYPGGGAEVNNWYRYAIEWSEDRIRFYIDETLVAEHDVSACSQYEEPMFILLNLAMGGNLGGAIAGGFDQATYEIDYVARCVETDSNDQIYCDEATAFYLDDDNDGVGNDADACLNTPPQTSVDANGCAPPTGGQTTADSGPIEIVSNPQGIQSTVASGGGSGGLLGAGWIALIGLLVAGRTLRRRITRG